MDNRNTSAIAGYGLILLALALVALHIVPHQALIPLCAAAVGLARKSYKRQR